MTGMNLVHKQFLITVISVCAVAVGCSNSIVLDNEQQAGIIHEERFSTQSSEIEALYTESTQADELEILEQQGTVALSQMHTISSSTVLRFILYLVSSKLIATAP